MWLNCIDPSQYLPSHDNLCEQLRKKFHCEDRSCTREVIEPEAEEARSNTEEQFENSWSDHNDLDTGLDTVSADPSDTPYIVDSGNNDLYEEPWDEQFEWLSRVPTPTHKLAGACFCPSASHAVTHAMLPIIFPVVPEQFDDE